MKFDKKRITNEFIGYKSVISLLLQKLAFVSGPEIEDILQETYIRTYQSALQHEINFPKAFMVKTALRLARRQNQQKARIDELVDIDELVSQGTAAGEQVSEDLSRPEQACIRVEEFKLLCGVINELPQQCRKVFIMKKIYGLSQQDIADSLRISQSTVEKHVAKGMLYCFRSMDKQSLKPGDQSTMSGTERSGDGANIRHSRNK